MSIGIPMLRNAILFTLALVASFNAMSASSADPRDRFEQIIQANVVDNTFMGSVLVAKDGEVLLSKGYGYANLEWKVANTPETKFRLGSITKQFTAACILLMEERGKLSVDDPVKKYLNDAPAAWDKVTIAELLSHTSGIPSFTDFPEYRSTEAQPTTPEALVARFRDKPLEFAPGTKWHYSNSGYVLLGYLLEKISGQTYQDFVEQNIFKKLDMRNSGYDSATQIIPNRASGYTPGEKGIENTGYIDMSIPFSAGALYSTTGDLLKWEQGLFGGKLLSPNSLTKMTIAYKENYGFGLQISQADGHKVIEHGGGIEGFNTHMRFYPDDKTVVIVLANLNGTAADEIATRLGTVSQGGKVVLQSERKEIAVPRAKLDEYVGVYPFDADYKIEISVAGNQLMSQLTGQPKAPLFAEATDDFFFKVADAQITFNRDHAGAVESLTIHQNGQDHSAKKAQAKQTP